MKITVGHTGLVAPSQHSIPSFRLHRPVTPTEALRAVASEDDGAVYAMGTTDLIAQMREGLRPSAVVSLRGVRGLRRIDRDGDTLVIGAGVSHYEGGGHPLVAASLPSLADAWGQIANVRIRFRATIGGNIMARRPRYEMSTILDALEAELCFMTTNAQESLRADEVWKEKPGPGALLTTVRVPRISELQFRYDRSNRPLIWIATAMRHTPTAMRVRCAVGSEHRTPAASVLEFKPQDIGPTDLESMAHDAANRLPRETGETTASDMYRRRITAVHLRRTLGAFLAGSQHE